MCVVEPECSLTLASDPIQYLLIEGKGSDENDNRLESIAQGHSKPQEGMTTVLQVIIISSLWLSIKDTSTIPFLVKSQSKVFVRVSLGHPRLLGRFPVPMTSSVSI